MSPRHALPKPPPPRTPEPVPPLVSEIREIVLRHLAEIDRFRWTYDAAEAAAFRVLAVEKIANGLRATATLAELAPRLAALDGRHQPREWAGSSTGFVCTGGCGAHPCETSRILNGQPTGERAA